MKPTILPILAFAGLIACAQSPGSIAPVSMGNAYANISCTEARAMLEQERQTLAALESAQQGAVVGDAIGVLLIAVPVSSLTGGDREGEIAVSKGKVLALEARIASC
jgi:hypothetical protein